MPPWRVAAATVPAACAEDIAAPAVVYPPPPLPVPGRAVTSASTAASAEAPEAGAEGVLAVVPEAVRGEASGALVARAEAPV
eukprot:10353639-Alexandrium_andersonii.AAC.1